jgi:hypothetical protein
MIDFGVQLVDKASAPAEKVARALTTAADRMKALESSAKSLEKQMAKASALGDHAKVAKLAGQHSKLVGALDRSAAGQGQFAKSLDTAIMGVHPATLAIGAYVLALGGLTTILYEGAKLAIAASAFKRETIAAFTFLTGSAKVGVETLNIIRSIEGSVPELESTLAERAKGLLTAGLDPSKLKAQLLTLSNVAAVAGEEGMTKLQNLQEKILTQGQFKFAGKALKGTGVTESDLAKQLGLPGPRALDAALKAGTISVDKGLDAMSSVINRKFGGAAEEKVKTLSGLSNKLHDNIFKIFEDVKTGPFIDGLLSIVNLFDQSSSSGKFFKWIVEGIFNKGFKESGGILLGVKHGIQQVIIKGLELYIAMKPTIATFKKLWDQAKKSEDLKLALMGVAAVAIVVGGAIGIAAGTLLVLSAATVAVVAAVGLGVGWVISKVFKFILTVPKRLGEAKEAIKAKITDWIHGIIEGILAGVKGVKAAVNVLAAAMPKALGDKLEIKSPSRVGFKQGLMFPAGVAEGMKAGSNQVTAAAATVASAASSGGGDRASSSSSLTIQVMPGAVVIHGGQGESTMTLTETALAMMLEKIALSEGLGSTS